jgi:hypothetical protein
VATLIYASLPELKSYMNELSDTADDENLRTALNGASRSIDGFTGRRFYLDDAPSARVYRTLRQIVPVDEGSLILVDDIADEAGVIVESYGGSAYATVDAATYELNPESAISLGRPATGLIKPTGTWQAYRKIRVTARWGWPAVPDEVKQACLIQASRFYSRKDSPTGVMGSSEWGLMRMPYMDPDVKALLRPLCIPGFA